MPSILHSYLSLFSTPLVKPHHAGNARPAPLELRSYPTYHPSLEEFRAHPASSAVQSAEQAPQAFSLRGKRKDTLSFLTLPNSRPDSTTSTPNASRLDLSLTTPTTSTSGAAGLSPAPSSMYSTASSSSGPSKRERKLMYNLHTPVAAHNLSFEDWSRFKKLNGSDVLKLETPGEVRRT